MAEVFLVDDRPARLHETAMTLMNAGHRVRPSSRPACASARLRRLEVDVIIVAGDLEGVDVRRLLARLSALQPRSRTIVIGTCDAQDVATVCLPAEPSATLLLATIAQVVSAPPSRLIDTQHYLEECLADDQLILGLQPVVALGDEHIVGYEGLLRSRHPVLSNPLQIFTAAKQTGMLRALGDTIAVAAADAVARLPDGASLFMKVHPSDFHDPWGLTRRLTTLRACAPRIVLEVSNSTQIAGNEWRLEALRMMHRLGFGVLLDDFDGTGATTLLMNEVAPDYVKVDMSLVRGLHMDPDRAELVRNLCDFTTETGTRLVAEGVETLREATALEACGADLAQGFYFGSPELSSALSASPASRAAVAKSPEEIAASMLEVSAAPPPEGAPRA